VEQFAPPVPDELMNDVMVVTEQAALNTTGLRGSLMKSVWAQRDAFISLLQGSPDLAGLASVIKDGATSEKFRVVIPADALAAIKRGEWEFRQFKDGTGFRPDIVNKSGTIKKKVRLVRDVRLSPDAVNAAAHASTHFMLRQVLQKLDEMDRKLDELLLGQQDGWKGQILAGASLINGVQSDPPDASFLPPLVANAIQSLQEGVQTGKLALDRKAAEICRARGFFRKLDEYRKWTQSRDQYAGRVDSLLEDMKYLLLGYRALAQARIYTDQPGEAQREMAAFCGYSAQLGEQVRPAYRQARFSPDREELWDQLTDLSTAELTSAEAEWGLAIEIDAKELLRISAKSAT